MKEDDFRTLSRAKLYELLLDASRKGYPAVGPKELDEKLASAWTGTSLSEPEDAREFAESIRSELKLEIDEAQLTGIDEAAARRNPVECIRSSLSAGNADHGA